MAVAYFINFCGNGARHIALEGHDAGKVTLIAFGPELTLRPGAYQLNGNACTPTVLRHRTLHYRIYAQLASDLVNRFVRAFVRHR